MNSISSLDPSAIAFLTGLDQIQRRAQQAQQQLTTGLKINSVSDSPDEVPLLMQIHQKLDLTQQLNTNLNLVKNEVDTGESSLQAAVSLVEQAQSLTSQGQTGFATADTRKQIAAQLGGVLQQMVSLANTSSGGRYIFSGNSDQTAPYSFDLTQTNPVSVYAGSTSSRQIQSPDGSTFSIALTASDIFDSSDSQTNVFQAINSARLALLNNDQPAINTAISSLRSADTYLNNQLAFYGQTQSRISSGMDYGATFVTQLKTQLGGVQDADAVEAITQMTQAQTQQQAALAARAQIPRTSLFNYLG